MRACRMPPGLFAIWAFCVLAFTACVPNRERAELVFMNGADPETLDPALITGQPEGRIASALFEGLTRFNARGEAEPGMAESWTVSEDGLTYTFHLRENVRWNNGDSVTAHDFIASWQRTLTPATASEYAYQLYTIKNGKAFNEGIIDDFGLVGVTAPDDRTLVVTLENPTPYFLDLCAFVTLLPVHLPSIAAHGDNWIKPGLLVSNGAFTLEDWRINDRLRLRRNPSYWDAKHVSMETIDAIPTSNANTAFNFYESGMADLMMDKGLVPPALMDSLREREDFHSAPFLGTFFLRFNTTKPPYDDPRVRRAIAMAIDRERIVKKITRAGEIPATTMVPPGTANYQPPQSLSYDIQAARQLLAEAGFPYGQGFPPILFLYNKSELNEAIAVEIQHMLDKALGIRLHLLNQEWKVYLNSISRLDYDIARSSWVGDYNDPNTFLDMFVTGGGNNRTGWSNHRYDDLIAQAASELDSARRLDLFREAERLLVFEEAPVVPIYFYVGIQLYDRARLGGIEANLLDEHPLRTMFWEKGLPSP